MLTKEEFYALDEKNRIEMIGIAYRAGYQHASREHRKSKTGYEQGHPLGDAYRAGYVEGIPSAQHNDYRNGFYNPFDN